MTDYPPIGSRVRYSGTVSVGQCVGTVMRHYPETPSHDRYVRMKVDKIPALWPYGDRDEFTPRVENLTVLEGEK